jgi:prepilin-type N-terminal cleavage/methylation domain-containing protein/prepilin-type processing-associated H-X9-DG protein
MKAKPLYHREPCGFTLLELLLVIVILFILAGLMVPALARAKNRVEGVSCSGNLKQWGLATHLFAAENHDFLPHDGAPNGISTNSAWYADLPQVMKIRPYHLEGAWRTNSTASLGNPLWFCPSNPRRSNGNLLFHFTLNRHVNGTGDSSEQRAASTVEEPAKTIWMFDNGKLAAVAGPGNVHTNLHSRGANFLFLDGAARRLPAGDYWNFARRQAHPNPPGLVWRP